MRTDGAPTVATARVVHIGPADLVPAVMAATLAVTANVLGWRGGDWPAQLLRVELVERGGPVIWNNLWYGGHHTPGYGVLFPLLAAAFGPPAVAVGSCVVAASGFHALTAGVAPRRRLAASALFASGTVVNVAVGRLTFALGLAIGVVALVAIRRAHPVLAGVLVVATAPASPVAGVMLAIGLAAWALHTRRVMLGVFALLATAPVGAAVLLFPQGGQFPFRAGALLWTLVVAAAVALTTDLRPVRIGAGLYAAACLAVFVVPNPLGANITRLGMFLAAPLLVATTRRGRVWVAVVALPAVLWWQWSPALDGMLRAGDDPSSTEAYHEPLVAAVRAHSDGPVRVEVVPTQRHWETVYVAEELSLARGWERQLDTGRNPLFYEDELDADAYYRWLQDNAVSFVALADVALDRSGVDEASILGRRPEFLEPVWRDEHWQLWRVVDPRPLVEGPARMVRLGPAELVLDVARPAELLVRVRHSSHWSLDAAGCVEASDDGWTIVRPEQAGVVTLRPVLARSLPVLGALDGCDGDS